MALLCRLLCLLRSRSLCQGLIRGVEILLKLVVFLFQCHELMMSVFVLPQGRDGLPYFFRIDLGNQIRSDNDGVTIERRGGVLLQDKDQSGSIGPNFIFRHIETVHDGDAFEVHGDLFQSISFGRVGGQANGVLSGVSVSHPVFSLGGDNTDLCESD